MNQKYNFVKLGFDQIVVLSSSEIEGFLPVKEHEFYIHLKIHDDSQAKKIHLQGSWKLQQLLSPIMDVLEKHLLLCNSIEDMLCEIKNAIEQQLSTSDNFSIPALPSVSYYELLLKYLKEIGWERITFINEMLNVVEFKVVDGCHREHRLKLQLPKEFPNETPTYICDLPEEFVYKWSIKKSLLDIYNHFEFCLQKYEYFWNWMDEIDQETCILEPANPTRKDCKRRIALGVNASLVITVDPLAPSSVPICSYIGPEQIVTPLREKFNKNIDLWDENFSLFTNLKNVLDMDFPSPHISKKEELCTACSICYVYELEEEIPEIMCKCTQLFHNSCLYKWLRSLPNARLSFNTIFGDCPYCSQPIWCIMPAS